MKRVLANLLGGRLQLVLIASFSLVAALTVGLNALVTSRVISDYLAEAEEQRVARDMDLASAFYKLKLDEIAAVSHRLVLDQWVVQSFPAAAQGQADSLHIIDQQITNKITVLALGGTHFIAVLDQDGNIVVGRVLSSSGELSPMITQGNWRALPIVQQVLDSGREQAATEILPVDCLSQVGLDSQAYIQIIETPKAAPQPFDPREGSAGY